MKHTHGVPWEHEHAFGDVPHDHLLRAICQRPECRKFPTHNIHRVPEEDVK